MGLTVIISLALLVAYVLVTAILTELPPSLSNTFYQLEENKKNTGYLFTLLCWGVGISVVMPMLKLSEGRWFQFIAFFAGGALCFVGAAPQFKSIDRQVHLIAAGLCAAATVTWVILMGLWYVPALWFAVFGAVATKNKPRLTFWLEMAAFCSAYHALLLIII
jgi:hypothetical protein